MLYKIDKLFTEIVKGCLLVTVTVGTLWLTGLVIKGFVAFLLTLFTLV